MYSLCDLGKWPTFSGPQLPLLHSNKNAHLWSCQMAHVPIWQTVEAPHVQVFLLNQACHPEKKNKMVK